MYETCDAGAFMEMETVLLDTTVIEIKDFK